MSPQLLDDIRTLARKRGKQYGLCPFDVDDLYQEGVLSALENADKTDIYLQINGAMLDYIARFLRCHGKVEFAYDDDVQASTYASPDQVLAFKERVSRVAGLSGRRILQLRHADELAIAA